MQTNHTRAAGAFAAVVAAAAVGYTLRPSSQPAALAERNPAVEVKTVVIRRTIHIVRHERMRPPVRPASTGPATAGRPLSRPAGQPVVASAVRTSTSHHAGSVQPASSQPTAAAAPLKTTTSKHATAPTQSTTGGGTPSAPVTTRTSRSGSTGGTAKPVTTRTSGKGHGDDGGGDGSDN